MGWDIEYQQIGPGNFDAWFSAGSLQELRLTNQVCNREMVICGCPPKDMIAIVLPAGGGHLGTYEGRALRPNDAIALVPPDGRVLCTPSGFQTCTVSVPRKRLEAALWHNARGDLSALLPESRPFALSPGRLHKLTGTIRALAAENLGSEDGTATLEIEDRLLRELATGLSGVTADLEQAPRRGIRTKYVRRARSYIDAHFEEAIPLSQVATHAGCSGRTLELAFREVLGVTPTAYILSRRLNKVRQRLIESDGAAGTLADLALEHGLFHFGRFSRDYRVLFGELPSETRGRSQPRVK